MPYFVQSGLSNDELEEYKEAFTIFGEGGDVPAAKLGTVLRSLGFCPTEAEVTAMQGRAGGSMNFDALCGFIAEAKSKTPSGDDLIEALKAFDHSGSGTIRTADLKKILTEITDEKLSTEQVDELIRDGDKYRTGEISHEFFARMVNQI